MTRISRFRLVFVAVVALALVLAQYAGASPLAAPQVAHGAGDGFFETALQWLLDLVGFPDSTSDRTTGAADPAVKGTGLPLTRDGKLPVRNGTSCIDPAGVPRPCVEIGS